MSGFSLDLDQEADPQNTGSASHHHSSEKTSENEATETKKSLKETLEDVQSQCGLSMEGQALLERALSPETQRNALHQILIFQLNNLNIVQVRLGEWLEEAETERRNQTEAHNRAMAELTQAKVEQADLLQKLTAGLISAK